MNIDEFGGWPVAHKTHFSDDGIFDRIYAPGS
jgi:ABC-type sulfate transport system substrate-binding protein